MAQGSDEAVQLEGRVALKRVAPGSKSEHEAAVLLCPQGEFRLRRRGGPSFGDELLKAAAGKRLRGVGRVSAGQFIVERYEIIDP